MSTHRNTWKQRERDAAAFFGTVRQRCSGSSGRPDCSTSDSMHPRLYIESKLRETHAARTLHDDAKRKARKEGKIPVVMLFDKSRPGFLICVHSDNFDDVAAERMGFLSDSALEEFGRLADNHTGTDGEAS